MFFYSTIEPVYYLLPFVGFIIGLFGTMLGGGGGFFFLPILILLLNINPQTAVITSLVASLPICIVGSWGHYRKQNIDLKLVGIFAVAGILGAFIGAGISNKISANQLKLSFGIYSVLVALNIVYSTWQKQRVDSGKRSPKKHSNSVKTTKGLFFGFFAGMITGTFGTSGTAPVLSGLFSMQILLKTVIGTSLLIVLVNTFFAVGSHFLLGKIDLTLVGFLTAGSTVGALIGPKIIAKTNFGQSENKTRYWYAVAMVAIGILMILK